MGSYLNLTHTRHTHTHTHTPSLSHTQCSMSSEDRIYRSSFDQEAREQESKLNSFLKSNPLVPICIGGAAASLLGGFWAFRSGKSQMSQYFQRARVGFQGAAVVALVAGSWNQHGAAGTHENKAPSAHPQ